MLLQKHQNNRVAPALPRQVTAFSAPFAHVAVYSSRRRWLDNVGDSCTYLLRECCLYLLKRDHSWPMQFVHHGLLTEKYITTHALRHYVLQDIGSGSALTPDLGQRQLQAGNSLLVCSDGLWSALIPEDSMSHLCRSSPAYAAHSLAQLALRRGTNDNLSLIVVQIQHG